MQRLKRSGDRTMKKARTRRARGEILYESERLAMQYNAVQPQNLKTTRVVRQYFLEILL